MCDQLGLCPYFLLRSCSTRWLPGRYHGMGGHAGPPLQRRAKRVPRRGSPAWLPAVLLPRARLSRPPVATSRGMPRAYFLFPVPRPARLPFWQVPAFHPSVPAFLRPYVPSSFRPMVVPPFPGGFRAPGSQFRVAFMVVPPAFHTPCEINNVVSHFTQMRLTSKGPDQNRSKRV